MPETPKSFEEWEASQKWLPEWQLDELRPMLKDLLNAVQPPQAAAVRARQDEWSALHLQAMKCRGTDEMSVHAIKIIRLIACARLADDKANARIGALESELARARQDAAPDNRTSVGCEARGHTWNTYNPAWATKCIVCGFEPPAVRSTQPPQTAVGGNDAKADIGNTVHPNSVGARKTTGAVGGGELPEQYLNPERWERSEDGEYMAVLPNGEFVRWYVFEKMREAYREAIAQRDQARETIYWLRRMGLLKPNAEAALEKHGLYVEAKLATTEAQRDEAIRTRDSFYGSLKLAVVRAEAAEAQRDEAIGRAEFAERAKFGTPCRCESWIETCRDAEDRAEAAEAKLAEIKRQIDELDHSVDPDTGADTTLERVQYLVGEMIAGNYAIPDRAALDVPKPEELERLAVSSWSFWNMVPEPAMAEWEDLEESDRKRWREMLSRLRSLPSESEEIERLYFIQDTRTTCGNAVMWWKPDGNGYTSNVNEAWRVPKEKADQMHRNRSTDVAWPVSVILGKAFPIFDFQNLRSIEKDK